MDDWRSYDHVAAQYERANGSRRSPLAGCWSWPGRSPREPASSTWAPGRGSPRTRRPRPARARHRPRPVRAHAVRRGRGAERLPSRRGRAIDLPFPDATFDLVTGTFVLNHFRSTTPRCSTWCGSRHGGRLALATWASGVDELQRTWRELVSTVAGDDMLDDVLKQAVPWEGRFAQRGPLEEALIDAGLQHVRTEPMRYRFVYSIEEFLDGREAAATGRFVRSMLGESGWAAFRERAKAVFAERFSDPLNDFRDVILAVATKPAYWSRYGLARGRARGTPRRTRRRSSPPPRARPPARNSSKKRDALGELARVRGERVDLRVGNDRSRPRGGSARSSSRARRRAPSRTSRPSARCSAKKCGLPAPGNTASSAISPARAVVGVVVVACSSKNQRWGRTTARSRRGPRGSGGRRPRGRPCVFSSSPSWTSRTRDARPGP